MCERAVGKGPYSLEFVPDWFVTQWQVNVWHDHNYNNDEIIEWYDGYQKRKAQKTNIKDKLMLVAWHPS